VFVTVAALRTTAPARASPAWPTRWSAAECRSPGAMTTLAYAGDTPIVGVPAGCCPVKRLLDILLPRLLAGDGWERKRSQNTATRTLSALFAVCVPGLPLRQVAEATGLRRPRDSRRRSTWGLQPEAHSETSSNEAPASASVFSSGNRAGAAPPRLVASEHPAGLIDDEAVGEIAGIDRIMSDHDYGIRRLLRTSAMSAHSSSLSGRSRAENGSSSSSALDGAPTLSRERPAASAHRRSRVQAAGQPLSEAADELVGALSPLPWPDG